MSSCNEVDNLKSATHKNEEADNDRAQPSRRLLVQVCIHFFKFKFESNNWYSTTAMETHHKRTAVESDINTGQESTSHEAICALIRMLEAQSKRFEEENEKLKAEIVELKNQVACFKFETTLTRRQ
jgi:hypothetical protein